jgi:hypothetical protein
LAASAVLGAQLLQRGQAVVREPERGEREHHGVDPDRQRHQDEEGGGEQHARRPDDAGRGAQVAGDDADAQQRQPMPAQHLAALVGGEAWSASASKVITR